MPLLLGVAFAILAALGGGAWLLIDQVGRTPAEVIEYTKRRLEGHTRLERVALPVLDQLGTWLGMPDALEQRLPFAVPLLPPNPAPVPEPRLRAADTAVPQAVGPTVLRVGPTRAITRIAQAAGLARDGDTVEIDPGDYVADVAVWDLARLTIRGTGPRVRLIAAGASAEGKAIWVIRRGRVLIENIDFIGARVDDSNGAGIRFESGQLTVRNCLFFDNQTGILTGGGPDTRLDIEHSEFAYNGAGDGQSHHIYVGNMKALRVVGSYFHHANVGHLIKSRAEFNTIEYNRLSDETGGRASYELEFPDGGVAVVVGNIIQQGTQTQNSVLLSFGAEGYKWPLNELHLAHNTLVNDLPGGGTFVRVSPGAGRIVTRNNLYAGPGRWLNVQAPVDSNGDMAVEWSYFSQPSREDYRLRPQAHQALAATALAAEAIALRPRFEYAHARQIKPLTRPTVVPGALQSASR